MAALGLRFNFQTSTSTQLSFDSTLQLPLASDTQGKARIYDGIETPCVEHVSSSRRQSLAMIWYPTVGVATRSAVANGVGPCIRYSVTKARAVLQAKHNYHFRSTFVCDAAILSQSRVRPADRRNTKSTASEPDL